MQSQIKNSYDIFNGNDLSIAELIQQRRLQLLINSYLYYKRNTNIITDKQWDTFAKELVQLQVNYPEISKKVMWYEAFKDFDGTTGEFLPLDDEWVINKSMYILKMSSTTTIEKVNKNQSKELKKRSLF